jgi:hypothetical protein
MRNRRLRDLAGVVGGALGGRVLKSGLRSAAGKAGLLGVLLPLGGVLTLVGVGVYIYVSTGRGRKDSPLVPNVIEERIDRLVEWLNTRFGKQWMDQRLDTVQTALSAAMPFPATALVGVVHQVERLGKTKGWSGAEKRAEAIRQSQQA